MRIKQSLKPLTLANIILFCLFLNTAIIHWLFLQYYFRYFLDILILLYLLINYRSFLSTRLLIPCSFALFLYPIVNYFINGGSLYTVLSNINNIHTSILMIMFFSTLIRSEPAYLSDYIRSHVGLFNILYTINIPLIILQIKGRTDLAGIHADFSTNNTSYDLISGMFGYNGTPMLALYSGFIIMLNFHMFYIYRNRMKGIKYLLISCIWLNASFVISILNENKGFFVIAIMYYVLYWIVRNVCSNTLYRKVKGAFIGILICLVGVVIAIYMYSRSTSFGIIINRIMSAIMNGLDYKNSYGSGVRIGLILLILNNPKLRWGGYGLGVYKWTERYGLGYYNFGQANLSSFIVVGGLIYTVLILSIIYLFLSNLYRKQILRASLLVMFIALALYTQLFTVTSSIYSCIMFCVIIWDYTYRSNNQRRLKNIKSKRD